MWEAIKVAFVGYGMRHFGNPDDLDGRLHVTPFSPYLYVATFLGALAVMIFPNAHMRELLGFPLYVAWCATVMVSVPMVFVGRCWARTRHLRMRYVAIWLRLGGGAGMLFAYLASAFAQLLHIRQDTDDLLFISTFIMAAVVLFSAQLTARDLWVVFLTETVANQLIRQKWGETDGD